MVVGNTRSRRSIAPRRPPAAGLGCAMDTLFAKVAGLDVHLKGIRCAVRCRQDSGSLIRGVRSFGTMTRNLRALAGHLQALGVTHVAMEATGVLAVGHSLLVIMYHVLKAEVECSDLRPPNFDRLEPERL